MSPSCLPWLPCISMAAALQTYGLMSTAPNGCVWRPLSHPAGYICESSFAYWPGGLQTALQHMCINQALLPWHAGQHSNQEPAAGANTQGLYHQGPGGSGGTAAGKCMSAQSRVGPCARGSCSLLQSHSCNQLLPIARDPAWLTWCDGLTFSCEQRLDHLIDGSVARRLS